VSPSNAAVRPCCADKLSKLRRQTIAQLESELITITRRGFEPREITRPVGRFLLMLENRSDLAAISMQLKREDGEVVREVRFDARRFRLEHGVGSSGRRYLLNRSSSSSLALSNNNHSAVMRPDFNP